MNSNEIKKRIGRIQEHLHVAETIFKRLGLIRKGSVMTNSELLRLLRSINNHNEKVSHIIHRIKNSGRQDAMDIFQDLAEQCSAIADAESIGLNYIEKSKQVRE